MNRAQKEFLHYVCMDILGMMGLSCYILADTFFVSKGVGANGLTALNLAIPVYSLMRGVGMMFAVGSAIQYTILRAEGRTEEGNKLFTQTGIVLLSCSALFVAAALAASGIIARLLGADESVFEMTRIYLKVILLFSPAFMINDLCNCYVRNDGNPTLAMAATLVSSLANIALDYIFIFPMEMGLFGAVLATGIAPVSGLLVLSLHWKKAGFCLVKCKIRGRVMKTVMAVGIPSLITEVSSGIVIIVFNLLILRLEGNIGVAAYGVVANISLVVTSIYTGIAQGMQPLVSRAYGRKETAMIKSYLRYGQTASIGISVVLYLLLCLLAEPIAGVFNSEGSGTLQHIAVKGMRLYFSAVPFVGCNMVLTAFFASIEQAQYSQAVSLLRGLLLIVPAALLMSVFFQMTGIWLSFPVTELLVSIVGILLYFRYRRLETNSTLKS